MVVVFVLVVRVISVVNVLLVLVVLSLVLTLFCVPPPVAKHGQDEPFVFVSLLL